MAPSRHRHLSLYEAVLVNLIWLIELHTYPHTGQWMMSIVDDVYRRVMGLHILEENSPAAATGAFRETMNSVQQPPHAVWTQNRVEFSGVFTEALRGEDANIRHVQTKLFTPDQRAKTTASGQWLTAGTAKEASLS
jgi:hypothetical protein